MPTNVRTKDSLFRFLCWTVATCIFLFFICLLLHLFVRGMSNFSWGFLVQSPVSGGRGGGIYPIIVSTFWILSICLVVCLTFGVGSAFFLSEFSRVSPRLSSMVSRSLDVLAGVPSIVFGLFGNVFFCIVLGLGFSILSGGLTLACMALPLFVRNLEEGLRQVSHQLKFGAEALALSKFTTFFRVLLPKVLPALSISLILSVGRALGETAALLFTSGYVYRMPTSMWDSGRALSVHIYDLAMNVPAGESNAYASALALIGMIVIINVGIFHGSRLWTYRMNQV